MSRTDAWKGNWLFISFISYSWQIRSSNSSHVWAAWLKDAFPFLFPSHSVFGPLFPCPALVLALRCSHWSCCLWFWEVLLSFHILGQLKSLHMYMLVSMGLGSSCAHPNFTPWGMYDKTIGKMQVPRISWVQGAKCCSSLWQSELRARGRFLGKINPQYKHVLNSKGCLAIWCGPYTWNENETLTEIRDWREYVCKDPAKLHDRGRILHHKKQIYFMKSLVDPGTIKSR